MPPFLDNCYQSVRYSYSFYSYSILTQLYLLIELCFLKYPFFYDIIFTTIMAAERPSKRARLENEEDQQNTPKATSTTNMSNITSYSSAYSLAEKFRLGTARLPLSALSSTWHEGQNRPLDAKQVDNLVAIYKEEGLLREPEDNHLIVACSKADFNQALENATLGSSIPAAHLQSITQFRIPPHGVQWPLLASWTTVNDGRLVEPIAGQHRVAALKKLHTSSDKAAD